MPLEINITKAEFREGFVICPWCNGYGGEDRNQCYGFGAKPGRGWIDCFPCMGSGLIEENRANVLKKEGNWPGRTETPEFPPAM